MSMVWKSNGSVRKWKLLRLMRLKAALDVCITGTSMAYSGLLYGLLQEFIMNSCLHLLLALNGSKDMMLFWKLTQTSAHTVRHTFSSTTPSAQPNIVWRYDCFLGAISVLLWPPTNIGSASPLGVLRTQSNCCRCGLAIVQSRLYSFPH